MDLFKAIQTFKVVVEQQSFSAAARELNLVVSAVSRQVTELEQHLNCKLLHRTTRSMNLTEEGRQYLQGFDEILQRVDSLQQEMQEKQQQISGQLRITAPANSGSFGIQAALSLFLKQHPEVQISWLTVNRYVNLIEEGIDLAIRVGELPDSGMIAREIGKMEVFFVASPEYLKTYGTPMNPTQLTGHNCILDSSTRQPGRWRYKGERGIQQIAVSGSIEVNNGRQVAEFASDGHGIALLPDFLIREELNSGRLVRLLEPYQTGPVPVSLVYPSSRSHRPALKALADFLVARGDGSRQR